MIEVKVQRPRCDGCENISYYSEQLPKTLYGTTLSFGQRYCTFGKKVHKFHGNDPKAIVPDWCPKRKLPVELRIYSFNDIKSRFTYEMFASDERHFITPLAYRYAVRYSGFSRLDAYEFLKRHKTASISKLYGLTLYDGEILEIDDGLMPYFFLRYNAMLFSVPFDRVRAQENVWEKLENEHN